MTNLSKATPRPWTRAVFMIKGGRDGRDIITQTGYSSSLPASRSHECEANAALIVKAVNLHDELVEALQGAIDAAYGEHDGSMEDCSKCRDVRQAQAVLAKALAP